MELSKLARPRLPIMNAGAGVAPVQRKVWVQAWIDDLGWKMTSWCWCVWLKKGAFPVDGSHPWQNPPCHTFPHLLATAPYCQCRPAASP